MRGATPVTQGTAAGSRVIPPTLCAFSRGQGLPFCYSSSGITAASRGCIRQRRRERTQADPFVVSASQERRWTLYCQRYHSRPQRSSLSCVSPFYQSSVSSASSAFSAFTIRACFSVVMLSRMFYPVFNLIINILASPSLLPVLILTIQFSSFSPPSFPWRSLRLLLQGFLSSQLPSRISAYLITVTSPLLDVHFRSCPYVLASQCSSPGEINYPRFSSVLFMETSTGGVLKWRTVKCVTLDLCFDSRRHPPWEVATLKPGSAVEVTIMGTSSVGCAGSVESLGVGGTL